MLAGLEWPMRLNFLCRIGDVYDATLDPTRQNETAYIWEEQR
jgi:hypothetical protein